MLNYYKNDHIITKNVTKNVTKKPKWSKNSQVKKVFAKISKNRITMQRKNMQEKHLFKKYYIH